jgi:hypothetical protein
VRTRCVASTQLIQNCDTTDTKVIFHEMFSLPFQPTFLIMKQEVLGIPNRLLCFDAALTAYKMAPPTILRCRWRGVTDDIIGTV